MIFFRKTERKYKEDIQFGHSSAHFYMGIILAKYGLALCKVTMRQTSTALKLPIGLVYGALPVLGMLILIYEVEAIWCILAGYSDGKEEI